MNGPFFKIKIITPEKMLEREITYIRLRDETGFFGIMKGHVDFLTILVPALGYYTDVSDKETFIAFDGGIFSVRDGMATLVSKEVFENEDPSILSAMIEKEFVKRREDEIRLARTVEGIERSFIRKSGELAGGKA